MDNLLIDIDRKHIWHPYASASKHFPLFEVESAEGVYLNFSNGKKVIDGMSSWWSVIHGYNHPVLNEAVSKQLTKMAHVMFGGLTHRPAVELAQKLIEIAPAGLARVFYCDSGSVAVEVAMKMAVQYQKALGRENKKEFLTIRGGYHGDTWHAMSVCDPVTGMHSLFEGILPEQHFVNSPECRYGESWDELYIEETREYLESNSDRIAAFILEPLVQGAGGMKFYSPLYLKRVAQLCKQYNVLLIADEIATGFGRTGKMFACNHADVTPDIMCVGKAITGGYMSFAATLCTNQVADTISDGSPGVLMHGPTFMGNPLACAVSLASIKLLEQMNLGTVINNIESRLKTILEPAKVYGTVADVRVLGAIGVIEMKDDVDMNVIQPMFVESGVWIRPFGKLIYTMPPFIINDNELDTLGRSILEVIKKYSDEVH